MSDADQNEGALGDGVHEAMPASLDHLLAAKRRELERVVRILFEEFDDAQATATGKRKLGRILKIILFGSYAGGGWVDEPHTAKGYQSDYDLLLIVNRDELTDRAAWWLKAEERLIREQTVTKAIRTPGNFIVHTLQKVNDALAHGRYFAMDIARDGIVLYQSDDTPLHQPKPKTPEQALTVAPGNFQGSMPSAEQFLETARFTHGEGLEQKAAFCCTKQLKTSATAFCWCGPGTLRTSITSPFCASRRTNSIGGWYMSGRVRPAPNGPCSRSSRTPTSRRATPKHYTISMEELTWLGTQVEELGLIVHAVCSERIAALTEALPPR